jgi:hypothetical protein
VSQGRCCNPLEFGACTRPDVVSSLRAFRPKVGSSSCGKPSKAQCSCGTNVSAGHGIAFDVHASWHHQGTRRKERHLAMVN